jgi:predicted phosphodiesterase
MSGSPVTRVAALYDIHGNLPALEAVLDDVARAGVDLVVIGGDVVPGPLAAEALELIAGLPWPLACLAGNGEHDVLAVRAGETPARAPEAVRPALAWVAASLSEAHVPRIAAWPASLRIDVAGLGDVFFCHATPRSDGEIVVSRTPEAAVREAFAGVDARLVVCGHTHITDDRRLGDLRIVNPGSVGMPFGPPGAYWLELGPDGVGFRTTAYDLGRAAERIRASGYPGAKAFAERHVLQPPSASQMLDAFSPRGQEGAPPTRR